MSYSIIRWFRKDTDTHKRVQCQRLRHGITCNSVSMPLSQTGSYMNSDTISMSQTRFYTIFKIDDNVPLKTYRAFQILTYYRNLLGIHSSGSHSRPIQIITSIYNIQSI